MQSDATQEIAARLRLMENLVASLLLNLISAHVTPQRMLDYYRERTIDALRQGTVQPGHDPDVAMALQTNVIEFAEIFFDAIADNLEEILRREQGDGGA